MKFIDLFALLNRH